MLYYIKEYDNQKIPKNPKKTPKYLNVKFVSILRVIRKTMRNIYPQGSINDNKMRQTDNQKSPNIPKMILPVSVVRVINT